MNVVVKLYFQCSMVSLNLCKEYLSIQTSKILFLLLIKSCMMYGTPSCIREW